MNQPMELDVWKGDWGLTSIDMECLRLITLCKFAGATVNVNAKRHALTTPKGRLPVFRHYKHTFTTYEEVSNYLLTKNLSPDHGLTEKQKADIVAFTMFLQDHLDPALHYVWWVDQRNRDNLTRKWWANTLPFPLGMILPNWYYSAAVKAVEALYPDIESEQVLEKEIYDRACRCLTTISQRLGSQEFMFGAHPTSIDATLFAYLAPLVKTPFPSSYLKNQVIGHNNLLKYVTRISQRYFASENQEFEAEKQKKSCCQPGQADDNPHKVRNQVLAGVFAVLAMGTYAITTGLVQVEGATSQAGGNLADTEDDDY
ncbi:metaxin-1 isoform X2 [Macrosteles quadrilineatus]|uniref:metaxin-1 isoform X2 n=1 Tax=Macrosteles quadrilineatus TaxID=74068 RepID=UPI0023E1F5B5|nr:metaxin-1 isoform X2 [Macrosteles quadrilineatus]